MDEWIATHAISWTVNYQNGVDSPFANNFFASDTFNSRGLTTIDPSSYATGGGSALDPHTYGAFAQAAAYAFNNWDSLSPEEQAAFLNPVGPDGKPLQNIPYVDPGLAIDSYNSVSGRIAAEAQAEKDRAQGQAALISANAQAADAANRLTIGMAQVAADRERTAATVGIANADRAENARQFNKSFGEQVRQFDLSIAEERRQFNGTMALNILQVGVQLAKNPVDWVAHQFYMQNLNIPLSFVNMTAAANMMGAIPPSGPSAAGPVVGGPAAMDGDTQLAESVGAQAGFVPLTEAVSANPGYASQGPQTMSWLGTDATAANIEASEPGGIQGVDQQLAAARVEELPQAIGVNPVTTQALQSSTQALTGTNQIVTGPIAADGTGAPAPVPEPAAPPVPTGAYGLPLTKNSAGQWQDGPEVDLANPVNPLMTRQRTAQAGATSNAPTASTPVAAATQNTGPFTGAPTEAAANTPIPASTGATAMASAVNPQGDMLIQTLAAQLGMDVNTLRNLIPTNLQAGGYSTEVIANSPVIQALVNQRDRLSGARTADPTALGGERFSEIGAFGIPLGIRSGQDINAGLLLKSNPDQQQMIQGAVEGTGQYFPTAVAQSLRASPVTQYAVGAFGRRRFS